MFWLKILREERKKSGSVWFPFPLVSGQMAGGPVEFGWKSGYWWCRASATFGSRMNHSVWPAGSRRRLKWEKMRVFSVVEFLLRSSCVLAALQIGQQVLFFSCCCGGLFLKADFSCPIGQHVVECHKKAEIFQKETSVSRVVNCWSIGFSLCGAF